MHQGRAMLELRVFHDVARALTSTLELDVVLHSIMAQMEQFFGPETWSLMMIDEARNDLYHAIYVGRNSDKVKRVRIPMGDGVAGWVAREGLPLILNDVASDPRFSAFLRNNPEIGLTSIACVPIKSNEKILGVLQLMNYRVEGPNDSAVSFLYVLSDYAAIAIQNARSMALIHELSITDDCTGLYNARHLYGLLDEQVQSCTGGDGCFSLLFLDLDHFKHVNDTHGHLVGTRLLAEVASLLRSCLGEKDAGFRYGGDEFVVLFPGMDKQTAIETTQYIYSRLHDARFLEKEGLLLTMRASFGLATFPEDGDSTQNIIRSADDMMYEVKNSTRDNIGVAGRGMLDPHKSLWTVRPSAGAQGRPATEVEAEPTTSKQ